MGATRVVQLSTTTFFDAKAAPLTEHSPLDPNPSDDPYTVTKRAAYLDAMRRVEDDGQDICIVISGGAYGVSPLPERSMVAPSYNARIALALSGEITEYVGFPIPWVYAGDVARAAVVATRKGIAGERYLAFGRPGDVGGVPWFCNAALEVGGVRPAGRPRWPSPSSTTPTSPPASGPAWWRWPASSSRRPSS